MPYFSAIKEKKVLTYAMACMHVKCIMLNDRSQIQKHIYYIILIYHSGKGKITGRENSPEVVRY